MAQDLSLQHGPVSDFLKLSPDPVELTSEQVRSYHENGFVAGLRILSPEQIDWLRNELAELFDPQHDGRELWHEYHTNESADSGTVLFHALGAWRVRPGLHDVLWHQTFVQAAEQLLDGQVRFWHDQLFSKPPRHGGVVAWHQDYSYWTRTRPMAHLTCWIGLDPATIENGCVHYIPGSHRWDLLPITGLAGDMEAIQQVLSEEQWHQFQKPVAAELQAGEATFHHPLMIHGSFANRSETPRRAVVLNVVRDGVCSDSDLPLMQNTPPLPRGQRLSGQFYPLLSPTEP